MQLIKPVFLLQPAFDLNLVLVMYDLRNLNSLYARSRRIRIKISY